MHNSSLLIAFLLLFYPLAGIAGGGEYAATGVVVSCDRWPDASSLEKFGRDCIRLSKAETNEEKAIAVWRFIQQYTEVGSTVPKEPAYGNQYIISPVKLLNVYGVHWCDGLSRIMTMTWRSLGYRAEKLYKFGHTLADCHWVDQDGVARWHVFDLSQHWFVYDRTGSHIATPDELALDHSLIFFPSRTPVPDTPSLMQPSYVHAGHLKIEPHPMDVNLRQGESILFEWGNESRPYQDLFKEDPGRDFEHGPYPVTYGNGRLTYSPDLASEAFYRTLYQGSNNLSEKDLSPGSPPLHPETTGKKGTAILRFSSPYIFSDAWISARVHRKTERDVVSFSISVDDGRTWRTFWKSTGKSGVSDIHELGFCPKFSPAQGKKPDIATPFGRYDYLLKVEMLSADAPEDSGIESLSVVNVFQHNLFALPMLWPGVNRIHIKGKLDGSSGLRIKYVWNDAGKVGRTYQVDSESLPLDYAIATHGNRWEDVRCRELSLEVLPKREALNTAMPDRPKDSITPPAAMTLPYPAERSIGSRKAKSPRPAAQIVRELLADLRKEVGMGGRDPKLNAIGRRIGSHVLALAALHDPQSAGALEEVIEQDISQPCMNKIWACQAIYRSLGRDAAPVMLRMLESDPGIKWNDPAGRWPQDTMWLHTAATAAAILADIRVFEGRERAADLIVEIFQSRKTEGDPRKLWRGDEISWGLIRALGKLGSAKHVAMLKTFLKERSDATAVAVLALKDIGDASAAQDILWLLNDFEYAPIGLNAIEALGALGSSRMGPRLYPFLEHWDEDFRGEAAMALGKIGDANAGPRLEEMLKHEEVPWVRAVAEKSLESLNRSNVSSRKTQRPAQ